MWFNHLAGYLLATKHAPGAAHAWDSGAALESMVGAVGGSLAALVAVLLGMLIIRRIGG